MPTYAEMDNVQLAALKEELEREYGEIKARGLALNMARGKPAKGHRSRLRPHHVGDRRCGNRPLWHCHAVLCDAEGTSWAAK